MTPVKLVVVDDHTLFRRGLISLLNEMPEFTVIGEAWNGIAALPVIRETRPDLVLIDVNMPEMNGVETVKALRSDTETAELPILMLTISKNEEDLIGAISAGADGYLLKSAEPEELRKAILLVKDGMSVLSPQVTRPVLRSMQSGQHSTQEQGMSEREMEVLRCLAQGMTTTQTADELVISENTVKTHIRHIFEKLGASTRAEAVSKAIRLGMIRSR